MAEAGSDRAGNLVWQNADGTVENFDYDALSRLVGETYSFAENTTDSYEITYTYDALGNRTAKDDNRYGHTSYTYDLLNRLITETTPEGDISYYYDANGNVVEKSGASDHSYSYSLSGLLTSVTIDGEKVQENLYDAENIRAVRTVWNDYSENREQFTTLSGTVIESTSLTTLFNGKGEADTTRQKRLIYGNGLEKIGDNTVVTNSHGDVKKLVGVAGELVAEYIYDAFGNIIYDCFYSKEETNDFLYASEQYDSVTDTYYLRARMYSPSIGRFIEEDPYLGDGRNLYAYVSNNPLKYVDPSGYCKQDRKSANNDILFGMDGKELGHTGLDIVGFIPVVGDFVDAAHAIWYLAEGDYINAALSGISIFPVVGDFIGKGGKAGLKTVKYPSKVDDVVEQVHLLKLKQHALFLRNMV